LSQNSKQVCDGKARTKSKAWREKNPGYDAAWLAANPKHRETHAVANKRWHSKHPGYNATRPRDLAAKAAFDKRWLAAKNEQAAGRKKPKKCEACGRSDRKICFDHCHRSKKFRGWICSNCNSVLGYAKDSVPTLRKLITYLQVRRHGGAGLKPPRLVRISG
jgi:recombination endonuclease VII